MKNWMGLFGTAAVVCMALSTSAFARLICYGNGSELNVNNEQVLRWKLSTQNQFKARAHVSGKVTKLYAGNPEHTHFQATIGRRAKDTLEVVFNNEFGRTLKVKVGDEVEACGDYITSTKPTQYPVSPDFALIHWLHENPRGNGHEDGFLVVNGEVFGQSRFRRR